MFTFFPSITTEAKSSDTYTSNYIEYINDDLYAEVEVFVTQSNNDTNFFANNSLYSTLAGKSSTKQRTASKVCKLKNVSGTVVATYTLTGTFQYNGSSSICASASYSTSVSDSNYNFSSKSASKSGNKATGSYTLVNSLAGAKTTKTVTITCSSNGTIQ